MSIRPNRILSCVAAATAAVLVLAGCGGASDSKTYVFDGATKLGSLIPVADRKPVGDVSGELLDGKSTFHLDAEKGKVVVVNVWATWCPPCRVETPQLDNVYRDFKDKGVTFVGIDTKDFPHSKPVAFVSDNDITYPMVYDEKGAGIVTLGNVPSSLPFSVLVDRFGRVAAVYLGAITPADLTPVLNSLRQET